MKIALPFVVLAVMDCPICTHSLNSNDFWRVYEHHKKLKKPYLSIMLIAAEWVAVIGNPDYIAECTVTKSSQHTYITLD